MMVKMNSFRIDILDKFKPLMLDREEEIQKHRNFILKSGRVGGKTFGLAQKTYINLCNYKTHDIQILRANSSSMQESIFSELKKFFFQNLPENIFAQFKWKSSPPLKITSAWGNQIHFSGVGLGSKSGSNISRGKSPDRPLSLIIVEETQEIFSGLTGTEDLLNHALATYLRYLDDKIGKVIYAGNSDRNVNGKFNVWCREKLKDTTFITIETNWTMIKHWLNKATIQAIEMEKELNPKNYEYMYMGIPVGGNDLVYGAFTQSEHILMPKEDNSQIFIDNRTKKEYDFSFESVSRNVKRVYFGVDGSTTRDMTVITPIFHFNDGKLICKLGEVLQHDPKKNGQIMNNVLANKYVRQWLYNLMTKYGLQYIEKIFVLDGHNTDLAEQFEYNFGGYCRVVRFTRKNLIETSDRVNNAFVERRLMLTHEEWTEIVSKNKIHPYTLYNELETVCWREDYPEKFNDSIPNDRTDSIRYPVAYHASPYQLDDLSKRGVES